MTRLMYDATTPSEIPPGATMVAGYVDGIYANMPALAARFPSSLRVSIAVSASLDDGLVLDVEPGNATPAEAPAWVAMRRRAGIDPSVYCDASTWPAVQAAFAAAGVAPPHYWIAQYDGDPTIPAGAVAKQYASNSNYDTSSVAAYWPGVDPTPEEDMPLTTADAQLVVKTLLNTQIWEAGDSPDTRTVGQLWEYQDSHTVGQDEALAALAAQNKALSAQVTALSTALAAVAKGELSETQVQAAVAAALAEAGHVVTPA